MSGHVLAVVLGGEEAAAFDSLGAVAAHRVDTTLLVAEASAALIAVRKRGNWW